MNVGGPPGGSMDLGLQIQAALLRKTQDVQEVKGEAAIKLIEQSSQAVQVAQTASSAHPHVGSLLDVYA